ncbi:DUF447 domain-containing protein [Methanolobus sp.]|uniref:DUF447 domain-containing protein n=1 Tax=Methanolobus sp. TaxID=1874737 RepID=UPI0025E6837D|nr:DUF447 domain-containing protein [Methanolobus sp.]
MLGTDFNLENLGIYEGICETIVTTCKGWTPNAAPMGIIRRKDKIYVRLYKGSKTYENVLAEKFIVANITYDPMLFALSTFTNLEDSAFEQTVHENHTMYSLKDAQSWVAFECMNTKITSEAMVAELVPIHARLNKCRVKAPNRGFYGVIEACIHATRYQLTGDEKYLKLIKAYGDIVEKCGGDAEKNALKKVYEFL